VRVLASRFDGAIVVSKGATPRAQNDIAKAYERSDVIRLGTQGPAIVTSCLYIQTITLNACRAPIAILAGSPEFIDMPAIRPKIRAAGETAKKTGQQFEARL